MPKTSEAKLEAVVEAVRRQLEGDEAAECVRQLGFAMNVAGLARHLHQLGGRGKVEELIDAGYVNREIVAMQKPAPKPPKGDKLLGQPELFNAAATTPPPERPLYETVKATFTLPADLDEALRLAAKGERKSKNQLVVEMLTGALARLPRMIQEEFDDD